MDLNDQKEKTKKRITLLAILFFIVTPVIYIFPTFITSPPQLNQAANEMVIYILLIVAVVEPVLYPLVERFQIAQYKRVQNSTMSVYQLYQTCFLIKATLVNSVFIYGLVTFFLMGTNEHIWKFYIIGIFWVIIYWPRGNYLENFLTKAGYDGI